MKKIVCLVLMLIFICSAAIAEEMFVQGSGAAALDGEYYLCVAEPGNDALVRRDVNGGLHISVRADELGDMVVMDGTLYYLMRTGDIWYIMGVAGNRVFTAFEFAEGVSVSDIGAREGKLFVLVDGRLHIIYLKQNLCLQLAGAEMAEYAVDGDYAYYIAKNAMVDYKLGDGEGNVTQISVGTLCRVNLSTGKTETIVAEGADDMKYMNGKVYFHNYADRYLMGSGADMTVEGRLYAYDAATGGFTVENADYDWDYAVTSGGVYVLKAEGLVDASGAVKANAASGAQIESVGDEVIIFDMSSGTFAVYGN